MDENFPKKKRIRVKSVNEYWSVKAFKSKHELEQYINKLSLKNRSNEEKTEKQRCRFCLAINPNSLKHMIQVYLNCNQCVNLNCSKTNICEFQKKYELLTKHKNLCPSEWIIFDENKPELVIEKIQSEKKKGDDHSLLLDDDDLSGIFSNMNIANRIQNEYNNIGSFYVWRVKDIMPSQTFLFKEIYLIKLKNNWIEFRNGTETYSFRLVTSNSDEIILRREDGMIFKLNSQKFYNCDENEVEYEGEWILDQSKHNPCIECSNEINKMVFECEKHKNFFYLNYSNEYRCWKANIKYDIKYFRRQSLSTWEEYCNDELTDTFKFIAFDKNGDLIIQRNSKENPDFLRFTERELFIGSVKDYIYYPLYAGSWIKESGFEQTNSMNSDYNLKSSSTELNNSEQLIEVQIENYLKLVRMYILENNIQINGLEDPVVLKYADSDNINKFKDFVRIVNVKKNQYFLCTGSLNTSNDVCIFDSFHSQQIDDGLANQIKKWFLKETITIYFANTKLQDQKLKCLYCLALLTAYVVNLTQINLSYLENLIFDEDKLCDHFNDCIKKQQISCFPFKNCLDENFEFILSYELNNI